LCHGFAWQGFGSGGATGAASVRSCEKLPPCLIKPVPASSRTDPPLAKAKPVSDGGNYGITEALRRGRKNCSETAVKERDEAKETTLQTPRSVKKQGGGGARDAEAETLPL